MVVGHEIVLFVFLVVFLLHYSVHMHVCIPSFQHISGHGRDGAFRATLDLVYLFLKLVADVLSSFIAQRRCLKTRKQIKFHFV